MYAKQLPLLLFAFITINLLPSRTCAQSTYIRLSPYYAIGVNKSVITEEWVLRYNIAASHVIEDRKVVLGTYAQGTGGNLAVGRLVSPNFGFELGANYLSGQKIVVTNKLVYYSDEDSYTHEYKASSFSIVPSLLFQVEVEKSIIYAKTGLILAFPSIRRISDAALWNEDKIHQEFKYSGGMAAGFNMTLGFEFANFKHGVTLFGELSFNALNYSPKQRETLSYTYNRVDSMATLNQSQLITEYSNDYSIWYQTDDNDNLIEENDKDKPTQAGSYPLPFSNLGFNIGLKFDLASKKDKNAEQ